MESAVGVCILGHARVLANWRAVQQGYTFASITDPQTACCSHGAPRDQDSTERVVGAQHHDEVSVHPRDEFRSWVAEVLDGLHRLWAPDCALDRRRVPTFDQSGYNEIRTLERQ